MTEKLAFTAAVEREIFGAGDSHIRSIENSLNVAILLRDGFLTVTGEERNVKEAAGILRQLAHVSEGGGEVDTQQVDYAIAMKDEHVSEDMLSHMESSIICHTVTGKPVRPKTLGQEQYIESVRSHMITFANGPAGTGKTYLAMALAVTAFQSEEVQRIILTRPAIEAGEKLGFLPGDLQQKIDPYLRPLYDALYQLMGAENFQRNQEKGLIEVAPLAYMRGRTLDNAFIILDEAQNTTPEQMKMFLTRLGFGSRAVITGDTTQKDLSPGAASGLEVAERILHGIEGISFVRLSSRDVVRHPLVQKIVKAYEEYDRKTAAGQRRAEHGKNHPEHRGRNT